MEFSTEPLAWRENNGKGDLYTASHLAEGENVKALFAACKESRGYITAEGWACMFSIWSLDALLEMDKESGWFRTGNPEEYRAHLIYQSLMSGYHPISMEKGDYDPDSGLFLSLAGRKEKIDWEDIIGGDI